MIYNLGIFIYGILVRIGSLFHPKAKKWVDGRKRLFQQFPQVENANVVWFHCASMGEYDQGLPIMEAWKKQFPEDFILVTFFSPSGYEYFKTKSIGNYTCYLPLDTKRNAKKFIRHFKPKKVFFIKYEIWINFLKAAKTSGSEIYAISANYRIKHRYFKWYGGYFRNALHLFNHIFVQNQNSKNLLENIHLNNITVSGDTRFDRVANRAHHAQENPIFSKWVSTEDVLVIGSSWPKDESVLLPLINSGKITQKIILAPHEVHEGHVQQILAQLQVKYQLYTDLQQGEILSDDTKVVILNCIGILAEAYKYGKIAYVGGGFGSALHNILEPAAFGLPVIFGPIHTNFPEASTFINKGIGDSIYDQASFMEAYYSILSDENIAERVREYIQQNTGATHIVMEYFTK
ncbi:MAG: 3-deoxy-D-manno-octulosonic acid transferase [Brumimicrobium sp.]|nr:3-deoxy-D-manno-octulosonic acid transferase [Brumimicrobium sp.]